MAEYIEIKGACIHNLKDIDVRIPKKELTVITGVSGSGKSSLAFDIIYEEGKRRYLSFFDPMYSINNTIAFKSLRNLSPTVAIEQRTTRLSNPRSTVATKTDLDTLLAMLFLKYGIGSGKDLPENNRFVEMFKRYSPLGMCPACYGAGKKYIVNEDLLFGDMTVQLHKILGNESARYQALYLFCKNHGLSYNQSIRSLSESEFQMYKYGDNETNTFTGMIPWVINYYRKKSQTKHFNPAEFPFIAYADCPECHGSGRGKIALGTKIAEKNIVELENMEIKDICTFLSNSKLEDSILLSDIIDRLNELDEINLGYLPLSRSVSTMSGGEIQRLCLANCLFTEIDSLVFVFDEPTIGLHEIERQKLILMLRRLVNRGNTVIVVEHDKGMIAAADYIIDIGPYAGKNGGKCIYQGRRINYVECLESTISPCFANDAFIRNKSRHRLLNTSKFISLENCTTHNLKNVSVKIPLGCLVGITGVSGSGKSSLVADTLVPILKQKIKINLLSTDDTVFTGNDLSKVRISGFENVSNCYLVSQKPIGKNSTSCVATVLGVFDRIRQMLANANGMDASLFSPNSAGACPDCGGNGRIHYKIGTENSIDFECKSCGGSGFIKEALTAVIYGMNIKEILDMECSQASEFFKSSNKYIYKRLCTINEFGLGYLRLGQKTTTLSGGEAQRLKLASELSRSNKIEGNIYVLDEPTAGLSIYDEDKLIALFQRIVDKGGTVVVSEHSTDFLSACDYLIELGPGGGKNGGTVISLGTPKELKANRKSVIGKFL